VAKGLVQTAQRGVVSQQDIDVAVQSNSHAGTVEEAREAGLRERRNIWMVDVNHQFF
jgi:hypothetical protein